MRSAGGMFMNTLNAGKFEILGRAFRRSAARRELALLCAASADEHIGCGCCCPHLAMKTLDVGIRCGLRRRCCRWYSTIL